MHFVSSLFSTSANPPRSLSTSFNLALFRVGQSGRLLKMLKLFRSEFPFPSRPHTAHCHSRGPHPPLPQKYLLLPHLAWYLQVVGIKQKNSAAILFYSLSPPLPLLLSANTQLWPPIWPVLAYNFHLRINWQQNYPSLDGHHYKTFTSLFNRHHTASLQWLHPSHLPFISRTWFYINNSLLCIVLTLDIAHNATCCYK